MAAMWNGKPLSSLKKDELIAYIADRETQNSVLLQNMSKEILSLKGEVAALRDTSHIKNDFSARIIEVERRIALQEQYSRRECLDIVNIPEEITNAELEGTVIEMFSNAGVKLQPRDFHAIHRKRGTPTVIAKLVNRRDTIDILRAKGFIRNFSLDTKKHLKFSPDKKIYINENLCPSFSRLMGISNKLLKLKAISGFYTLNGMLRLKLLDDSVAFISHLDDLRKLFGETVDRIMKDHDDERKARKATQNY